MCIRDRLRSRDTDLMMNGLRKLGVVCRPDPDDPTTVRVIPMRDRVFHGNVTVDCGLAGTVMRFLPGLALFADGPVSFDGDEQAYARPMKPVLDGLEQMGASVTYRGRPGFLPFVVRIWGMLGSASPVCVSVRPPRRRDPISSSPETN